MQCDARESAVALLSVGGSGRADLLKDSVAEGVQVARAIRTVSSGGWMLAPKSVEALLRPVSEPDLSPSEDERLGMVAEGLPIKAIAARRGTTAAGVAASVEQLFFKLATQATGGREMGLR